MHVQAASSASRRNLARPVATPRLALPAKSARAGRPAKVPAALSFNFDWRIFCGVEENPSDQKVFLGDEGASRQVNAANIHLLNISICLLMKMQCAAYALKQTDMQIKMLLQGFKIL